MILIHIFSRWIYIYSIEALKFWIIIQLFYLDLILGAFDECSREEKLLYPEQWLRNHCLTASLKQVLLWIWNDFYESAKEVKIADRIYPI